MKKIVNLFLVLILCLSISACNKQQEYPDVPTDVPNVADLSEDDTLKEEMYFAVLTDTYYYLMNQTSNLTLERSLFINSKNEYEPYYYEMVLEPIGQENIQRFLDGKDNLKKVIVDIYNETLDILQPVNGNHTIDESVFDDVDFMLEDRDYESTGELYLVSYSEVPIKTFDPATIAERELKEGESCNEDYSACVLFDEKGNLDRFFPNTVTAKEAAIDFDGWLNWVQIGADGNPVSALENPEDSQQTEQQTEGEGNN